jgi:hypothetical protein
MNPCTLKIKVLLKLNASVLLSLSCKQHCSRKFFLFVSIVRDQVLFLKKKRGGGRFGAIGVPK